MTEKAAKKLGEVLAFSYASNDLMQNGHEGLTKVFHADTVLQLKNRHINLAQTIKEIAAKHEVLDIVTAKADKTHVKLNDMANLYIKDEWDNPAELLEWGGFFVGAAIVHWQLVAGVAEQMKDDQLSELSEKCITEFKNLFTEIEKEIKKIGHTASSGEKQVWEEA
jgi:hypothetical protein